MIYVGYILIYIGIYILYIYSVYIIYLLKKIIARETHEEIANSYILPSRRYLVSNVRCALIHVRHRRAS